MLAFETHKVLTIPEQFGNVLSLLDNNYVHVLILYSLVIKFPFYSARIHGKVDKSSKRRKKDVKGKGCVHSHRQADRKSKTRPAVSVHLFGTHFV